MAAISSRPIQASKLSDAWMVEESVLQRATVRLQLGSWSVLSDFIVLPIPPLSPVLDNELMEEIETDLVQHSLFATSKNPAKSLDDSSPFIASCQPAQPIRMNCFSRPSGGPE